MHLFILIRGHQGAGKSTFAQEKIAEFKQQYPQAHIFHIENDIEMTDDQEEGLEYGNISNLIYEGDHYLYIVHTDSEQDFAVYDEDLWNMGDRVGLIMPTDKMKFSVTKRK